MKTKIWLIAATLGTCLYASSAAAELVIGVKAGAVDYDVSGSDPGINGSVQIAFDMFNLGVADIALEAEHSISLSDGELFGADADFTSTGVYASLRTLGPVYVIARAGFVDAEIDVDGVGITDDSGSAMGVGIGFSAGLRMEIEYTKYEIDEVDIEYITLGFGF